MTRRNPSDKTDDGKMNLASNIVAAYVGNNKVRSEELPGLLQNVYAAVSGLAEGGNPFNRTPAVPIDKSVTPEYIICLEDGKKLKMLKRYLRTHFDLSTEEYRRKWGLPADYPMTAPNYAKRRSKLAKDIGLGRLDSPAGRAKRPRTRRKAASAGKK
jgi:predicted transcriptional regulator